MTKQQKLTLIDKELGRANELLQQLLADLTEARAEVLLGNRLVAFWADAVASAEKSLRALEEIRTNVELGNL